jgi:hypothetical protein
MPHPRRYERDFPHLVEIVVPERGLRNKLEVMYDFHARHGIEAHLPRRHYEDGRQYIRWRFADLEVAKAFAAKFAMPQKLS